MSIQMNDNNLNKHSGINTNNKPQGEQMKPAKGVKKNAVLIAIISVVILVIVGGLGYLLNNVASFLGSSSSEENTSKEQGISVNAVDDFKTVDIKIPKPKPKPEVKPQLEVKGQDIPKENGSVQNAPVTNQNDFVALMNRRNANKTNDTPKDTRKTYDVLKASNSLLLKTHTDNKAIEDAEKAEKAELAKKEAEEQAKKEAAMYPYGYTYRWVNGVSVKVPNTRPIGIYADRYAYRDSASALGNSVFQARISAIKMDLDKNFLLPKGTFIPCSLDTRIITDLAGGVNCTIRDDVYSDNGKVLLIEKGSKVYGFFENGQIKVGMDRVFVVWQEIRTPSGIAIPIDSFATDELGSSGAVGQIDYHWALRFTSSVMVSIFSDTFANLSTRLSSKDSGGRSLTTDQTQQTGEDLATETLKRFIDIEPTLLKNQGELIGIYVNKDVDFSDVYELDLAE